MNSQKKTVTITKLIKLVQEHPVLYDSKNLNYRNKKHREDAWNAIAETLGESGKLLKDALRSSEIKINFGYQKCVISK